MKFMQIQYRFVAAVPSKQVQYLVIPEKLNNMLHTHARVPGYVGTCARTCTYIHIRR